MFDIVKFVMSVYKFHRKIIQVNIMRTICSLGYLEEMSPKLCLGG